jgi:hypothetical protein
MSRYHFGFIASGQLTDGAATSFFSAAREKENQGGPV